MVLLHLRLNDFRRVSFWNVLLFFLLASINVSAFKWPWESDSSSSSSESSTSTSTSASASVSVSSVSASPLETESSSNDLYAPYEVSCPSHKLVREADGLSSDETAYIKNRQAITNENLIDFLNNTSNLNDFDAESFINENSQTHNITIGLAFSGGGYRAMLCGAGELLALDDRYDDSNESGLGGLLQSSTYLVGLSGGNWLVGSVVLNNFISIGDVVDNNIDIWDLKDSILSPNGRHLIKTAEYYRSIQSAILSKQDAGFDTSITDIWGRALSYQFLDDEYNGENITWSSIRDLSKFENHEMPFPIVVANGRTPNTVIINENSTVFEINPYELGSWDPSLKSFMDVKYVGSSLDDGDKNSSGKCVNGFDNAGFIMGTSSSLFNQIILKVAESDMNSILKKILNAILGKLSYSKDDIAAYEPNPFLGVTNGDVETITTNNTLFLVDGGEDQQNVPLYPLIQNDRDVDIIFAYDNSADTDSNWPNGSSLVYTYQRQFSDQGKGTPFPYVPTVNEFIKNELNKKPVFFGCDASNLTSLIEYHDNKDINETDIPLIVYMPNADMSYQSNTSTYQLSYEDDEKLSIISNGFEVSSRANFTDDEDWAKCVGCAIIRRQQERMGFTQSKECKECFNNYCWDGNSKNAAKSHASSSSSSTTSTKVSSSNGSSASKSSTSTSSGSSSSTSKPKKSDAKLNLAAQAYILTLLPLIIGFVVC